LGSECGRRGDITEINGLEVSDQSFDIPVTVQGVFLKTALQDPDEAGRNVLSQGRDRFGLAVDGDEIGERLVADLDGRPVHVAAEDWTRYHAAAVIAATDS
jgi:hypothetical protein